MAVNKAVHKGEADFTPQSYAETKKPVTNMLLARMIPGAVGPYGVRFEVLNMPLGSIVPEV